jgi:Cu/Ag efflux protein CusF
MSNALEGSFAVLAFVAGASTVIPESRPNVSPWDRPSLPVCRAQMQETDATGIFHGVGVVTAIDAATGALTLDHEDIVGLMPAMIMMYRVKSREVARGLSVGDKVAFDLDAKSYTILNVQRLAPAK